MTGTEKIKTKILEDAAATAAALEEQAKQEAAAILAEASETARKKNEEIISKAEAEGTEVYRRMMAVAGLDGRKELLRAKQDMVDTAFRKAMDEVIQLPDMEYQKLIEKMITSAALNGDGEILMSEADIRRMDTQFLSNIRNQLDSIGKTGRLTLSTEGITTKGGFILRYGDMEINSTFEILFGILRPQLEQEVVKLLFVHE